ncbi:hypothetical protein OIU34_25195 [Pararhizobium sp. BT-229]|uniref:hypothetical protein n=1 Tax=Pararhizobium sp. BT-229 TaxID=2986923 RepID=UPI0021F773EE|nr:hypothetical protein [Pararhizobium sp. BT-229]MCV9965178.1 hypothetical protein [Pararhizobium sp. BT-229]
MSNQWGRDHQVTRGGGSSGALLPIVLCLALVGAGVYFWFARQALQAEIAALTAQTASLSQDLSSAIAEKDKANNDLAEFRKNSGNWAGELEQEYAELKLNEVPKLNRLLDKRDADISTLEKLLSTEKAAAKSASDDFTATLAKIQEQLNAAKSDTADARKQAQDLAADKVALNKQIASLRSAVERAMADTVAARKALEQKQAEAEKKQPTFKSALDLARDVQIQTLEQSLGEERRKVAALEKQLADQAAAAALAKRSDTTPADTPADNGSTDTGETVSAVDSTQRDGALVETVLGATRGLGFLDDEKTQRLKDKLIAGACVTDALESVFDKVPLVLMRNLMRDLKSDC